MSGTSQAVTEASGTITVEETVPNRLRYNGQMADGLTGLYYLRARYYNASLGRFTQEDVIYKYIRVKAYILRYDRNCKNISSNARN